MEKRVIKTVIVLLGPTASGKTALAVALAKTLPSEIISADSRQVYRDMNIGTGKDLDLYNDIPYHLINICEAGEKYNLARFQADFEIAAKQIIDHQKTPILCGGTGMYIQAVIQGFKDTEIPENHAFRASLEKHSDEELLQEIHEKGGDFKNMDTSTRKRKIRILEKLHFVLTCPTPILEPEIPNYTFVVFGLNPEVKDRRQHISKRLAERLNNGLIEEVRGLLKNGIPHETLQYYGLEYKYVSLYLSGEMSETEMHQKLETEIHRYAKRQMTFFRSMESKGIEIKWLPDNLKLEAKVYYILKNV